MLISQRHSTNESPVIDIAIGYAGFSNFGSGEVGVLFRDDTGSIGGCSSGCIEVDSDTVVNDGNFHHIAVVRDAAEGKVKIYIDGVLKANVVDDGLTTDITTNLRAIASERYWVAVNYGTPDQRFFNGLIDEVAIYNRVLSEEEILNHYLNGLQGRDYCDLLPVKGVDVSSWQGCEEKGGQDIDWSQVYGEGYRFALVRASWWDSGVDKCFVTNMENADANGMLVGAYHFAYPEYADAGDEARHFFNVAKDYLKEGYLKPALDIENDPCSNSYPYNLEQEGLSDWVNKWMDTVQALARHELQTEVEPMLYVNRTYANFLDEHLADVYDLWIAHPTCEATGEPDTKKWNNWAFWQYYMPVPDGPCPDNSTGPNSVPGIDGTVDLDVFNGDISRLQTFKISAWEPDFWILFHLCSPADMVVTDPDGLIISKELNQIPGAAYVEIDIDQDGDLDKEISIPYKKVGYYQITIVPEPNALPTDTYSLEATIDGQTMVLAEDVQIQDIPAEPYEFESKLNYSDFDADGTVNFTDYASFASHWMASDCNYPDWCEGSDLDYDHLVDWQDLMQFVENWLWEKIPADFEPDGDVDFADYAAFALHWMDVDCNEPDWCSGADLNKSGSVDLYDLAKFAEHWLEGVYN